MDNPTWPVEDESAELPDSRAGYRRDSVRSRSINQSDHTEVNITDIRLAST